jgi:hypothetical protein
MLPPARVVGLECPVTLGEGATPLIHLERPEQAIVAVLTSGGQLTEGQPAP